MINYLKDLYNKFIQTSNVKKVYVVLLLLIYTFLLLTVLVTINVEVTTPGGVNHTAKSTNEVKPNATVTFDTENKVGQIYTVGVHTFKPISYFQYFLSRLSNDIDVRPFDPKKDLSKSEENQYGAILKDSSVESALIVAYEAANKIDNNIKIVYSFEGLIVSTITKQSKSDLQVNDVIIKVEDIEITSFQHFRDLLANIYQEDYFKITVKRNGVERVINSRKIPVTDENDDVNYMLGINAIVSYNINNDETFPKFTISEKHRSIGSSGGAMLALAFYNALITEDVTKNKIIVGTGTIDITGKVGDIGGISQKIATAHLMKVDIFFVNPEDHDEALKKHNEINPLAFKLIKVSTFEEILIALAGEVNE